MCALVAVDGKGQIYVARRKMGVIFDRENAGGVGLGCVSSKTPGTHVRVNRNARQAFGETILFPFLE